MTALEFLKSIPARHEALKKRIHNFRYPLSPFYLKVVQVVYFTIPVVIGYYIMEWSTAQSVKNLGAKGELMKQKAADQGNRLDAFSSGTSGQNLALQSLLNAHKPAEFKNKDKEEV
jgi:hypothetical protein